jgi:hypothetical protein
MTSAHATSLRNLAGSPDWSASPVLVPYGDLGNPQTFNLYSYVANNPLNGVDPDGHLLLDPGTPNYNDPDTGAPLYGEAVTAEQAKDAAQNTATQAQNQNIAQTAQDKVDHTEYEQDKSKDNYKAGANKCNQLCADVVQESGAPRPQVPRSGILGWLGLTRDPTAHELADPRVHIAGWSSPMPVSSAKPGDIIAQQHNEQGPYGHAGVVVTWKGKLQTVSVNSTTTPKGIVTRNDWGFRPRGGNGEGPHDPAPVVRRYVGGNQ